MLFDLMLSAVVAVLAACGLAMGSYALGYKQCLREAQHTVQPPMKVAEHKKPPKVEEKYVKILQNIDKYDGTSRGQIDVE